MATEQHEIVDGDGHVIEDIAAIWKYMPEAYVGRSFSDLRGRSPFPPIDHLHTANRHFTPPGAFANVGREGWEIFLREVGIGATVLYTSAGLAFGKIVSRDWAIELARAYNNWIYDTYVSKSPRFKAMGLIPLQEPAEAVIELRRIVRDLGFCGAMLPSTGANMPHLGSEKYRPIYGEAERLGCALAIHGGAHEGLLMDDMSPYAPVNALGHPMGQMICFAGIVFNGIFDQFPGVRIGFMEAGSAWLLTCLERFTGSWESHVQYDPRGRFLRLRQGEKIIDYICRHIDEGRIFVGVEGDELTIAEAVRIVGNKPFVFSTDYPHEVDAETCKHELEELQENPELKTEDKQAVLSRNARRFYGLARL
ncbi:MAG TPA: amidohydrolase family protein [candidate division Zixibacteria bacterium]|nr:amidohydrolase family protein [candidate division Zixibacteria bacterium]